MNIQKLVAGVLGVALSTVVFAADAIVLKTDEDKLSYSIGADLGKNFKRQNITVNSGILAEGFKNAMGDGTLQMNDDQIKEVLTKFQKDLMAKRSVEFNKIAEDNKAKGEAFLKDNKAKPGVVTLPSGLQYKIIKAGTGARPNKEDTVTVEYTGHLIDGKVFDSTQKTGKPATFKVSQVIPGWVEAIQLMPIGSTWEVYIPSNLAYGPRSIGSDIGPNETLVFNIHLVSAEKPVAAK